MSDLASNPSQSHAALDAASMVKNRKTHGALRLPGDDRERRAMLENGWAKGVKLDMKWYL